MQSATLDADLSITHRDNAIVIDLQSFPAATACWKLERAIEGQAFVSLLNDTTQGLLGGKKYTDQTVEAGIVYRYRITPLNGDMAAGTPFVSD